MSKSLKERRISIQTRIIAVVMLPLLLLAGIGVFIVQGSMKTRALAQNMYLNAVFFQADSNLITELQRERGRTSMFLSGRLTLDELDKQRAATDLSLLPYLDALASVGLGPGEKQSGSEAELRIGELRSQIGTTVTVPSEAIKLYSAKIETLTALMAAIANMPSSNGIGKGFTSLLVIESAKENAGILRATVSAILGENKPVSEERLITVLNLKGGITINLDSKALIISPKNQTLLRELPLRPHWQEVDQAVNTVVSRSATGNFDISSAAFWDPVTMLIDDLGALVKDENGILLAKTKTIESSAYKTVIYSGLAIILIFFLSLSAALLMARQIIRPLRRVVDMLKDISEGEGDLTKRLEASRRDEIGDLSTYFNRFVQKIQGIIASIADNAGTVASSATELSAISQQTTMSVGDMTEKTATAAAAAEESSANTVSVAASMEQASSNLATVASATEEMSATIGEIASNSDKARSISSEAGMQAASVSSLMTQLGKAANDIGKVTETITGISSQTNLLALNATIEAARAGAAGKGFAVVANEIKDLAKQTAAATEDIKNKIGEMQASTGSAITDIEKITAVIQQVGYLVSGIATAIEEQATVTRSVAGNIAQASAGVRDANERIAQTASVSRSMAQDIAGVDSAAGEIKEGGIQVQSSAAELSKLAEELKSLVGQFKIQERQNVN